VVLHRGWNIDTGELVKVGLDALNDQRRLKLALLALAVNVTVLLRIFAVWELGSMVHAKILQQV
jgi:hypothetical protein